jgi:CarD family transcriptional regulator
MLKKAVKKTTEKAKAKEKAKEPAKEKIKPKKIAKETKTVKAKPKVQEAPQKKERPEPKIKGSKLTVYKKGDKVVYPMHGVGLIEEIKNISILGKEKSVYVINILNNSMTVMIPKASVDLVGLRPVISKKEVEKVLIILRSKETEMEEDWKLRYQINMEKVKTGSIFEVAEVARNLYRRSLEKDLSIMERKLYENAYQLITNEIALAKDLNIEDAGNIISEVLS